jgi:hypothetical protein
MAVELDAVMIDLHREAGIFAFFPGLGALRASRGLVALPLMPEVDPEIREDFADALHG